MFVGGTTVTRATLANQEVIRARGIKIGDTVLVRRAGDVIPFVAGVLDASKRTGAEREIVPPSECPSCGQPLTEQGNSRELFCTNVACPAQTVRRLIHWASRAAADIEAVGPVWIERLAEAGDLEKPSDFYALTKERLLEFERIGEVSAERMIESIDAVEERRAAARADRARDPDGLRGHGRAPVPRRLRIAGGGRRRGRGDARRGRGHRPEGRRVADRAPRRGCAPSSSACASAACRSTCATRTSRPVVASDAPLAGKTVVITGSIADPRSRREGRRGPRSSACARRPARRPPRRCPRAPTC